MIPSNKAEALEELMRVWGDSSEARIGRSILDLLAEHLDFNSASKLPPVITQEKSTSIEALIK
jgi:U3 small nucleolar ribonucleoprotein component